MIVLKSKLNKFLRLSRKLVAQASIQCCFIPTIEKKWRISIINYVRKTKNHWVSRNQQRENENFVSHQSVLSVNISKLCFTMFCFSDRFFLKISFICMLYVWQTQTLTWFCMWSSDRVSSASGWFVLIFFAFKNWFPAIF